ncbi:UDP-glucose 4-epimerase Gal10 [Gaeumannomyces tritici R3-111a-1]|uniref:DNA-directed RNA polymerases I, II, and III subunit RPABC3 n=1 Tax=Gaeumannomyces tritici (strain R3-111a-1) TaxID=644352 RepID=J3P5N0_GAET3|nr:UDP-glucose 4-epimerase Gal10 [Gaeumannomyces tritici R3-111a-1]EJT74982.1 UDP-glucose 4-epimerase Gal10 [Gaeumannomyces tritici R3-111a-1]
MAGSTGDAQLFEGVFKVTHVDAVKYDRVARITATSDAASADPMDMTLDINTELFPMSEGDGFRVVLATSLALDGSKDEEKGWRDASKLGGPPTLADNFDYVCYGKVYRFEDSKNGEQIKAYMSFGGLLMCLNGPYKKLTPLRVDYVYLLVKGSQD